MKYDDQIVLGHKKKLIYCAGDFYRIPEIIAGDRWNGALSTIEKSLFVLALLCSMFGDTCLPLDSRIWTLKRTEIYPQYIYILEQ